MQNGEAAAGPGWLITTSGHDGGRVAALLRAGEAVQTEKRGRVFFFFLRRGQEAEARSLFFFLFPCALLHARSIGQSRRARRLGSGRKEIHQREKGAA